MKAYFTHVPLPVYQPKNSSYHKKAIKDAIDAKLVSLGIKKEEDNTLEAKLEDNGTLEAKDDGDEEDSYLRGDNMNSNVLSIYRNALMSFVDHYAGLRLLERRSVHLPKDETITLSLVAVRQPTLHYRSWEEMKKVILKTCEDFGPISTSKSFEMIKKIETAKFLESDDGAIVAFKKLLALNTPLAPSETPSFKACIHCESSLATILCQLHIDYSNHSPSSLGQVQASPSSYLPPFTL